MLRMRGMRWPWNGPNDGTMVERSAGHFQMPADLPQYPQSALFLRSTSTSQLERLAGSKSIRPVTQTYGSVFGLPPPPPEALANGMRSLLSCEYWTHASVNCRMLFMHIMPWALSLDLLRAGRSIAARMAMMAITTSSSISVQPESRCWKIGLWVVGL